MKNLPWFVWSVFKIYDKLTLIFIIWISKRIQEERNAGTLRSARTAWISEAEYSSILGNTVGTWSKQRHVYIFKSEKNRIKNLSINLYIHIYLVCIVRRGDLGVYNILPPLDIQYLFYSLEPRRQYPPPLSLANI